MLFGCRVVGAVRCTRSKLSSFRDRVLLFHGLLIVWAIVVRQTHNQSSPDSPNQPYRLLTLLKAILGSDSQPWLSQIARSEKDNLLPYTVRVTPSYFSKGIVFKAGIILVASGIERLRQNPNMSKPH